MTTIRILRADVTTREVVRALERGLGPHYHVLSFQSTAWPDRRIADDPDSIVIGTGSCRVYHAHVRVVRNAHGTELHVRAGGPAWHRARNALGTVPKIVAVLRRSRLLATAD